MNSLDRLHRILSKVTYKPGWRFELQNVKDAFGHQYFRNEYVNIILHSKQKSIDDPEKEVTISHVRTVDGFWLEGIKDEQILSYLLTGMIKEIELHEVDEWFKYDGIHVKDPHPELKGKP